MRCKTRVVDRSEVKFLHQCSVCKRSNWFNSSDPAMVRMQCGTQDREDIRTKPVPSEIQMLAGDRLAEMIALIGIPPCGACDTRRKWLNAAHAWLRGEDWRKEL